MQATMDPKMMPREALEAEVVTLRRRDALCGFQGDALRRIGDIAAQATATARDQLSAERFEAFKRKVVQLSTQLIDAVVNIADAGKDALVAAVRVMCRLAMDIANYIYDNFADIITIAALSLGVCMIVFDVVLLAGMALTHAGILAPAVGGTAVFIDFETINRLAGF